MSYAVGGHAYSIRVPKRVAQELAPLLAEQPSLKIELVQRAIESAIRENRLRMGRNLFGFFGTAPALVVLGAFAVLDSQDLKTSLLGASVSALAGGAGVFLTHRGGGAALRLKEEMIAQLERPVRDPNRFGRYIPHPGAD